jgi:hypothetical protein
MRPALWRRALLWPGLYAVAASASLIAISPLLRNLGPHYTIAMMAMAWLWWCRSSGSCAGRWAMPRCWRGGAMRTCVRCPSVRSCASSVRLPAGPVRLGRRAAQPVIGRGGVHPVPACGRAEAACSGCCPQRPRQSHRLRPGDNQRGREWRRRSWIYFVRESLARGASKESVGQTLASAGWSSEQVTRRARGLCDVASGVPVPKPRASLSAREAFLYLVLFASLYLAAWHLGSLLFDLLDYACPTRPISAIRCGTTRSATRSDSARHR